MKKDTPRPNLVPHLHKLTTKEKAVLCRLFNFWKPGPQPDIHLGTLPFVSYGDAMMWLANSLIGPPNDIYPTERTIKQIMSKLGHDPTKGVARFCLYLIDRKVYRRFGHHPERGVTLDFLPKKKVTVGMKNQFGRVNPDKDVLVSPHFSLRRVNQNYWEVVIDTQHQADVEEWLAENCR